MPSVADPLSETRRSDVVQAATAADGAVALADGAVADGAVALADAVAEVPDAAGVRADVADPAAWPLGLAVRLPVAVPLPPAPQPASAAPASTAPAASMSHGFIVMVVSLPPLISTGSRAQDWRSGPATRVCLAASSTRCHPRLKRA
jgi:hypothetical protein